MELYIISGYAAICIALFTGLRIPLNKWTLPTASIGGIVLTFALIQLLNFYHPYSELSQQHLAVKPATTVETGQASGHTIVAGDRKVIAWFPENSLLRLEQGSEIEITFNSVPGKVFAGLVKEVLPVSDNNPARPLDSGLHGNKRENQSRIPVLLDITDKEYAWYASQLPDGARAQVAVYGREFKELALVRKTLLHMSAWMSYLSPLS